MEKVKKSLKEQLEAQRKSNAENFKTELEALQQKYECDIVPIVSIIGNRIETNINIVPK